MISGKNFYNPEKNKHLIILLRPFRYLGFQSPSSPVLCFFLPPFLSLSLSLHVPPLVLSLTPYSPEKEGQGREGGRGREREREGEREGEGDNSEVNTFT